MCDVRCAMCDVIRVMCDVRCARTEGQGRGVVHRDLTSEAGGGGEGGIRGMQQA